MGKKYQIKDCSERMGFNTREQAVNYLEDWGEGRPQPFRCPRCQRWHFCSWRDIPAVKKALHPIRCTTDRELHMSMARALGISLEELDRRVDLSRVHILGPGVEIVKGRG